MKTKLMIAVEYYNNGCTDPEDDDATTTYEIFDSLEKAKEFINENQKLFHSMWVGDFNKRRIYTETQGRGYGYDLKKRLYTKAQRKGYSYDDLADTFGCSQVICGVLDNL